MQNVYRFFVYIGLFLTVLGNCLFGSLLPKQVKTQCVPVNGSFTATDELGRQTVSAGASKKQVGIFYFLFCGDGDTSGPYDIQKIIANDPQAYLSGERWEAAGGGPFLSSHHWGEPLFGYYSVADRWVLSRHCQMLTDAGVDFLVFDTTNDKTYAETIKTLIDVWYGYLEDGWNVPKLAFYTHTDSGNLMNRIFDEIYNDPALKERYPRLKELWFRLNGKPMIVGWKDDPNLREDVRRFFRIKAAQWPSTDDPQARDNDGFPWMEFINIGTFRSYYKNSPIDKSIMSVSVAQHLDTVHFSSSAWFGHNDHGRSWHNGAKDTGPDAVKYGYNFAEQWDYAIGLDPDIIFVTGFNEWLALRLAIDGEPVLFFDECDNEYSRDIEPAAGILGDNYYMQLVQYITKFKNSTRTLPRAGYVTIDPDGSFSQWDNPKIRAVYRDYRDDVFDRSYSGYGDLYYADDSGRNDLVHMKVAEDAKYLYFYADTAEALTAPDDGAWMTLFINTCGKEGYDFCINRQSPKDGKTKIEAIKNASFESCGEAEIRFAQNRLMLKVPKTALGFAAGKRAAFSFKWADNCIPGDVYSFYTRGDSAPYGRLNYSYGCTGVRQ